MRGHCGSSHKVLSSTQAWNNELNGNYDKNVSPCIHTYIHTGTGIGLD